MAGHTCSTKKITVVDRPLNEWMTDNILALKAIRRENELIWRKIVLESTSIFIMKGVWL